MDWAHFCGIIRSALILSAPFSSLVTRAFAEYNHRVKEHKNLRFVARQIVKQNDPVRLNARDSVRFVDALLAQLRPPAPAMKASIRAYRKLVKSDLDYGSESAAESANSEDWRLKKKPGTSPVVRLVCS